MSEAMKNVNRVRGRDGVERLYFRKAGQPSVPLKSAWGTAALEAEVAALRQLSTPKAVPGTLEAATRAYEVDNADFRNLMPSTKYEYRLILKEFDEDYGPLPLTSFDAAFIQRLRNAWAKRGHRAANIRLQVLKNVLSPWLVEKNIADPFARVGQVRRPQELKEPHRIWPEAVVETVITAAIAEKRFGLARGVAIGRYVGARRGDIVKLTEAARKGGQFSFVSGKRRVLVQMPEDPALTRWLAATPKGKNSLILAYNMDGRAYSEDGFALELGKLVDRLFRAGRIESDAYTVHGLRHTFGVELALAGCTDAQGAAMMGHGSPNSFATYRRQADRISMASDASAKVRQLRERSANAELQNDVQNSCKTRTPEGAANGR